MNDARPSIRRTLLLLLMPAMLLVWLITALLVYYSTSSTLRTLFDTELEKSARVLQMLLLHEVEEELALDERIAQIQSELDSQALIRYPHLAATLAEFAGENKTDEFDLIDSDNPGGVGSGISFIALYPDGSVMTRDSAAPSLPELPAGFSLIDQDDQRLRVFTLIDAQTGFKVQVIEDDTLRSELVLKITWDTLLPFLLVLPLIALLISLLVGRALKPLQKISKAVSLRPPESNEPIRTQQVPVEIASLVENLNQLLSRIGAMVDRERRFTADAAHELRTPLAAIKTHLQVAQGQTENSECSRSIKNALNGVDRTTHLVQSLLTLTRTEASLTAEQFETQLNLNDIVRESLVVYYPLASERDIELELEAAVCDPIPGNRALLSILVGNLIENALRYTPKSGKVWIETGHNDQGIPCLRVIDSGPGIPESERKRVFERFYRGVDTRQQGVMGSGLGLSIVANIARLHGAEISLSDACDGRGLRITVVFKRGK